MSARIEIFGRIARIKDGVWSCDDKNVELLLKAHKLNHDIDYHGYDPNPDLTAAEAAIKEFGGKLLYYTRVHAEDGVIY